MLYNATQTVVLRVSRRWRTFPNAATPLSTTVVGIVGAGN